MRQRAYSHRSQNRGKNQTIIGAIALKGIIAALTFEGGTDGSTFQTFVEQDKSAKPVARSLCCYG